jgi:serine protease AprX
VVPITALIAAVAGLGAGAAAAAPGPAGSSGPGQPAQKYIVFSTGGGAGARAAAATADAGGSIVRRYHRVDGVVASIRPSQLSRITRQAGVTVVPDVAVTVQDAGDGTTRPPAAVFPDATGATALAALGDTGSGVTVAVLDTGIDPRPDFAGRLIGGVDLTGGGDPFEDDYGHGTFVAGLIAGDGSSSDGEYTGEATGADLVSIKVAGADGVTDLATVISGVEWAIDNASTYGIKVLNLSLGFPPIMSTVSNPLDQEVESAWQAGITVVASAGNAGPFNGTVLSPGDDPLIITVGALDDQGTADPGDDTMTDFSSVGPTNPDGWEKPDLVAAGRSVVSLAAPGSTVYADNPSALVGSANFVGSGTSFSAAITSGAVALVLADNPSASPNQVKARLLGTAAQGPTGSPFVDGHGSLDVAAAATVGSINYRPWTRGLSPTPMGATVALGNNRPVDTWNRALWSGTAWYSPSWPGGAWDAGAWRNGSGGGGGNGAGWNGYAWNGGAWNGLTWTGGAWNGGAWNGGAWNGGAWNGGAWNGEDWAGGAWNGAAWSGGAWNGSQWG